MDIFDIESYNVQHMIFKRNVGVLDPLVVLSPKVTGIVTVSLISVGVISLLALGLLSKESVTGRSGITRLDKPAPNFTLNLFDGDKLTLAEHIGQPMVINFWNPSCPPCVKEAPLLEKTWRSYMNNGVQFIGVGLLMLDTEQSSKDYIKKFDITYPNGLDKNGTITVDYGVIGLPVTFFVNREGIVERRWVGAIREEQLVTWVKKLSSGTPPSEEAEGENPEDYVGFK